MELDARGFQFKPHLNKHGQPYPQQGRRYRGECESASDEASLGRRIFLGTTLVVVAVLGSAPLATKRRADAAADDASARALGATASSIAGGARQPEPHAAPAHAGPGPGARLRLPHRRVLRAGDRANLLDQADELRVQTGADWVLVTDGAGVLQAWTARRDFGEDFSSAH